MPSFSDVLVSLFSITLINCFSLESGLMSSTKLTAFTSNDTHMATKSALTLSTVTEDQHLLSQSFKHPSYNSRKLVPEIVPRKPILSTGNSTKARNSSVNYNSSKELHEIDSSRISDVSKLEIHLESSAFNKNETVNNTIVNITTISTTLNPKQTTVKAIPTKPMRTEHDELNYLIESKQAESHSEKIPSIDLYAEKRNRRADYVVPIVAVILSVPLVAIIISVLYKRSIDWWQHRNYRRMDFLIEGMYNN